ncbi:MAG: ArnT family glycosyltransferase [Promethearchaeota archaeon]
MLRELQSKKWIKIFLFFGTFIIYILSINDFASSNEASRLALIQAIVHNRSFIINEFADQTRYIDIAYYNGNYYSDKAPGLSFIGLPIYLICNTFGFSLEMTHFFLILINAFFTSLATILIYEICNFLDYNSKICVLMALIFAFGTIAWVYAKTFLAHGFSAFLFLLSMYYAHRFIQGNETKFILLSGVAIGYSFLVEYSNLFLLVPFLVYFALYKTQKKLIYFLVPIVLLLILLGTYHYVCFGNPFSTPYRYYYHERQQDISFISNPVYIGLYGLLFSPQRGLFFISPVLLLSLYGFFLLYKKYKPETILFLSSFIIISVFYSMLPNWHGAYCYGPRYLLAVVPFIVIPLGTCIEKYKENKIFLISFSLIFVFSIIANALGALVNPFPPFSYEVIPLIYNASYLIRKGQFDSKLLLLSGLNPLLLFGALVCSVVVYIFIIYRLNI